MPLNHLRTAIIGIAMISMFSCTPHDFTCTLKGTVVDRKSDTLMLKRVNEDTRFVKIFIPIVDGKFEYTMEVKDIEAWDLTFKDEFDAGGWRPIQFFPDQKEVSFELHPTDQPEKNKVLGGKVNQAAIDFANEQKRLFDPRLAPLNKIADSLRKGDLAMDPELKQIYANRRAAKSEAEKAAFSKQADSLKKINKDLTPAAAKVYSQFNLINQEIYQWRYEYISKNLNIHSYFLMLSDLLNTFRDIDVKTIKKVYPPYANKFPDHPYTALIRDVIDGLENIKVGGHFIDFTLPDLNGNKYTLSELIKGKVAIIDLWATWCGPCIRHTRELAPIYDEYNEKGFAIVGVAAEFKNTDEMKKRLEKEKWPWVNLVELDHQNHIWDKYGASFGGGKVIMVDKNGIVLAVNPTAEEVRAKLKELL